MNGKGDFSSTDRSGRNLHFGVREHAMGAVAKESILPSNKVKRVAVEALTSFGWHKYTGFSGKVISLDTFGESAPANLIFEKHGFTTANVVAVAKEVLK